MRVTVRRRVPSSGVLPPLVEIPTGHVRVVVDDEPDDGPAAPAAGTGWAVRDGRGVIVLTDLGSRGEALRAMGGLALRGAELPLSVLRPDGRPTGDHLA